jgi:hypothetical protein
LVRGGAVRRQAGSEGAELSGHVESGEEGGVRKEGVICGAGARRMLLRSYNIYTINWALVTRTYDTIFRQSIAKTS